jgi:hypothetical protein
MSNFTNILLTYIQDRSHQLEILHFIYCAQNNLSYGKLLVIKGSLVDKTKSKYVSSDMTYDNLVNEIKKQCGTKCCTLKGLSLSGRKLEKSDGLAYIKYYEDNEDNNKMLDLEYFSTKNNVILLADNDVVLNIKKCVIIPIDKLTLHLNYSLDETHSLNMSTETKTNFFEFLNSYNMGQCQHVLQLSNTEEIVQNNTKLQLDLEMQLASAKLDNLSMNSELEELRLRLKSETELNKQLEELKAQLETELRTQLETLSEAKFKLETELLSMSRSNLSLEKQLFEAIESKVKLETELESLKITKSKQPSMINNPKNLHLNSAKKPLVTSTNVTKSKINPAMTQIINSSKVSTSQKQTPKTKPRCTF